MVRENTVSAERVTIPLTEEDFKRLYAISKGISKSKTVSSPLFVAMEQGFTADSHFIPVEEMFKRDVEVQRGFSHAAIQNSRAGEREELFKDPHWVNFLAIAFSCSCRLVSCGTAKDVGCPIDRDTEAFRKIKESVTFDESTHSIEVDLVKMKKGLGIWFKDFPTGMTGRACGNHALCMGACTYNVISEEKMISVLISYLEASGEQLMHAFDWFKELYKPAVQVPTEAQQSVAIVGAGPGGLMTAYKLAKMGYKVTIYDGQERVGGTYRDGIPWDKYDKGYLDEMKTLLEGMGVEFKMNTRVGNKAGEVSTETLESQHDVVVVATGVIHKPRKMPVENGEGNIMDAMTYLHAQNKWLDQFHERKKTEPELTIQQYEAETPFELSTKGRTVLVFGKGYTGYDIIRLTSRDMCADGDPTKMDGKILWVNRRIEGDGPLAYPDNTFDDKSDPSMMMFAHLEKLHPSQAEKQFLLEPKEIKTNADGKIIEVVFYQKEITNPLVAEKFPDRAIYKTLEETVTKTFSPEENVLIIAAAGFDKSRPDALFQSLGIADENKMATTTGSYTKRNGYFVAGDVSPNCKSEVVHTFKSADDTANEVDRYLQQKAANRTEAIPRGFVAQDTWDSMAKESVMEKAREHLSHLPPGPKTVCGCNAVA